MTMSRLAVSLFLATSSTALAQNTMNIRVDGQNDATHAPYALSVNDCNHIARITFSLPNGACQNSAGIFVTTSNCGNTPGAADVQVPINFDGVSANTTVSNLATFQTADAGTLTCPQPLKSLNRVCGTFKTSSGAFGDCSQSNSGGFATIYYKGLLPNPPSIDSVTPLDTEITVNASTTESDIVAIHVEVAEADGGTFTERAQFTSSVGYAKIGGLTDNVTYSVRARAEDQVPQLSDYSGIVQVTPILTQGFWDRYLAAGGAERGGCGGLAAMTFVWCLPGIVLLSLLRRKRSCGRPDKS